MPLFIQFLCLLLYPSMNNPTQLLLLLLTLVFQIDCKLGVDLRLSTSDVTFQCLAKQNIKFVVVEAYEMGGHVNPSALQNLKYAKLRKLQADISMDNCPGKNPQQQVQEMFDSLPSQIYDTVWISVKVNMYDQCRWESFTPEHNCDYLTRLVAAVESRGKVAGIFSDASLWHSSFKNTFYCGNLGRLPLWYQYNDDKPKLTNFTAFGGWTTPSMKMYSSLTDLCQTMSSSNYKP